MMDWGRNKFRVLLNQWWISFFFFFLSLASQPELKQFKGQNCTIRKRKNCNRNDLFGHKEQDRGPSWVRGGGIPWVCCYCLLHCHLIQAKLRPAAVMIAAAPAGWTPNSQSEGLRSWGLRKSSHGIIFSLNLITVWPWKQAQYCWKVMGKHVAA